jgi:general secretion pathway protein D
MTGSSRSKHVKLTAVLLACVGVWAHAQDDLGDIDALLLDLGGGAKPKAAPAVPVVTVPVPKADRPAVVDAVPAEAVVEEPLPVNEPKTEPTPAEAAVAPKKNLVDVAAEPTPAEATPAPKMLVDGSEPAMPDVLSTPASREAVISELATLERMRREAKIRQGENELTSARDDMTKGMYDDAKRKYSNALSYIPDTPDTRESRIVAEKGLADAHYQHALLLRKKGLLEQALAEARAAQGKGQEQADRLVGMIRKDMEIPPKKAETVEIPRMNQLEYKESREKVAVRMRRARQHYVVGEYTKARDEAELVVKEEPFNVEAIRLLRRIAERMNDVSNLEHLTTRERMIRDVSAAWTPDRYGVDAAFAVELKPKADDLSRASKAPEKGLSPEQEIQKKMQAIMIPSIQFNAANITDVISFFEKASREYDTEKAVDKRGVNFVIKTGAGTAPASGAAPTPTDLFTPAATGGGTADGLGAGPITFSARFVTLYDALKTVMDVSNMKFRIKGNIVTIMPMNIPDDILITRSYNVLPTLTERVLSTHREIAPGGGGDGLVPAAEMSAATDWKGFFGQMGVNWPEGSAISYLATIGKLRVSNTADNLANFEQVLEELNVTPRQIEVEARFVEVAQEDLNSLGFEWILNGNLGVNTGIGALDKYTSLPDGNLNPLSGNASLRPYDSGSLIVDGGGSGGSWIESIPGDPTTRQWQWNTKPPSKSFGRGSRFLNSSGNGVLTAGTTKQDDLLKLTAGLDGNAISMILHALSQKTSTDVLSAPKVVTKSGQEAIMKVVTEYIYPTDFAVAAVPGVAGVGGAPGTPGATTVSPSEFDTREVGVILQVLPEVSADGQMINLMMNPQVVAPPEWKNYGSKVPQYTQETSIDLLGRETTRTVLLTDDNGNPIYLEQPMEQPIFRVRSVSTSISIYNGATVVMGGMITEERVATFDKIPFLGDLPYIGRLFQSKGERTEKRNLLIFVTARLVDPAGRVVRTAGEETLFTGLPEALPSTPATP